MMENHSLGIARFKPTRRGCRVDHKKSNLPSSLRLVEEELNSVESIYGQPIEFEKNDSDLHIPSSQVADLSNIQESKFPNCGFIAAGDFNHLDVTRIKKHFQLKQTVKSPTRKDVILELVLTNLNDYHVSPEIFPPFGLSDHNVWPCPK